MGRYSAALAFDSNVTFRTGWYHTYINIFLGFGELVTPIRNIPVFLVANRVRRRRIKDDVFVGGLFGLLNGRNKEYIAPNDVE